MDRYVERGQLRPRYLSPFDEVSYGIREQTMTNRFHMRGNPALLKKGVTVIGSSRPCDAARNIAYRIGRQIADIGRLHISGGAAGVDIAGHAGAIHAGGSSVMVLPHGIDYQPERRPLFWKQADREHVLELSQFANHLPFSGKRAIERNATVVQLSNLIIVVETDKLHKAPGRRSGTFQTATFALQANVPTFCVMPTAMYPLAAPAKNGNQALIDNGAIGIPPEAIDSLIPFLCEKWPFRTGARRSDRVVD